MPQKQGDKMTSEVTRNSPQLFFSRETGIANPQLKQVLEVVKFIAIPRFLGLDKYHIENVHVQLNSNIGLDVVHDQNAEKIINAIYQIKPYSMPEKKEIEVGLFILDGTNYDLDRLKSLNDALNKGYIFKRVIFLTLKDNPQNLESIIGQLPDDIRVEIVNSSMSVNSEDFIIKALEELEFKHKILEGSEYSLITEPHFGLVHHELALEYLPNLKDVGLTLSPETDWRIDMDKVVKGIPHHRIQFFAQYLLSNLAQQVYFELLHLHKVYKL